MIRIGNSEPLKGADFAGLHVGGLLIITMIVAEEVERPVDEQMGGMLLDADSLVSSFRLADAASKYDVAEQQFDFGKICR